MYIEESLYCSSLTTKGYPCWMPYHESCSCVWTDNATTYDSDLFFYNDTEDHTCWFNTTLCDRWPYEPLTLTNPN